MLLLGLTQAFWCKYLRKKKHGKLIMEQKSKTNTTMTNCFLFFEGQK